MFPYKLQFRLVRLAAASLLLSVLSAQAADGVRYAPILPQANMLNPEQYETQDASIHIREKAKEPTEEELNREILPELKGLLFVDLPKRLYAVSPDVQGVEVEKNSRFAFQEWDEFNAAMRKYIGKPVTMKTLRQMEKDAKEIYKKHSISYIGFQFPQQDAANGTLQVVLIEGKVQNVKVEGARWFKNEKLEKWLYVKEGNYFDQNDLREDSIWLGRNPFRDVDVDVEPADELGNLNVTYKINDMLPLRGTIGYTDTGTKSTGIERFFLGGTYGNLFGMSNILNYQMTSTTDFKTVVNHSVTWMMPIAKTRNFLTVHGNYASIDFNNQDGINWGSGFDLNRRLWTKATEKYRRNATWSVGFDFLHADTDVDVGGISAQEIPVETAKLVFGFDWNHLDKDGFIDFNTKINVSPGGFSKYNDDLYFQNFSGTETRADYIFATFELDMLRHLEVVDVHTRFFGQVSSAPLITYDQVGMGGSGSVRGYHQYTDDRDCAFIMNAELLTPSQETCCSRFWENVPPYHKLNKHYTDNVQLYTFFDLAVGGDINSSEADSTATLAGTGLGLKYSFGPWISLDAAYGFQLIDPEWEGYAMTGRPHVTFVLCR